MKSVPEDRRKSYKYNDRENEVVHKLSDQSGNICLGCIRKPAVRILLKCLSDRPVQEVVQSRRREKCDGASQQDEPGSAKDLIKRRVITRIGRNGTRDIEDQAGQQVDHGRKDRDLGGRLRTEMLCNDIHAHKGQPGYEDSPVQGDPVSLDQRLVGKQVHADHADHKERDRRRRDTSKQYHRLFFFSF